MNLNWIEFEIKIHKIHKIHAFPQRKVLIEKHDFNDEGDATQNGNEIEIEINEIISNEQAEEEKKWCDSKVIKYGEKVMAIARKGKKAGQ